jgi:VCBS repeat-containing protein
MAFTSMADAAPASLPGNTTLLDQVEQQPGSLRVASFSALEAVDAAALELTPPEPTPPDPLTALLMVPATIITGIVNGFVSFFEPVVGPGAPFDNPLVWGLLSWTRRQTNLSLANSSPTLNPQQTLVDTDDRQIHGVLNADDADEDALTFSVPSTGLGAPAHGDVTIDALNERWTYTPNPGFSGPDAFFISASDESAGSHLHAAGQTHTVTKVVNVTVAPPSEQGNEPPTAHVTFDSPDVSDGAVRGSVGATDPDGDHLTYALGAKPLSGNVVLNGVGGFKYTPDPEARLVSYVSFRDRIDAFNINVSDGHNPPVVVTVTVPVDPAGNVVTREFEKHFIGFAPNDMVLSPNGDRLYVQNTLDRSAIAVWDTGTGAYVEEFTGPANSSFIVTNGVHIYQGIPSTNSVDVRNADTGAFVKTIGLSLPPGIGERISLVGTRLYIQRIDELGEYGDATVIDTRSNDVLGTVGPDAVPVEPLRDEALSIDGSHLYQLSNQGVLAGIVELRLAIGGTPHPPQPPPGPGDGTLPPLPPKWFNTNQTMSSSGAANGTVAPPNADPATHYEGSTEGPLGTLVVNPDGSYTFTPSEKARALAAQSDHILSALFLVKATDSQGNSDAIPIVVPLVPPGYVPPTEPFPHRINDFRTAGVFQPFPPEIFPPVDNLVQVTIMNPPDGEDPGYQKLKWKRVGTPPQVMDPGTHQLVTPEVWAVRIVSPGGGFENYTNPYVIGGRQLEVGDEITVKIDVNDYDEPLSSYFLMEVYPGRFPTGLFKDRGDGVFGYMFNNEMHPEFWAAFQTESTIDDLERDIAAIKAANKNEGRIINWIAEHGGDILPFIVSPPSAGGTAFKGFLTIGKNVVKGVREHGGVLETIDDINDWQAEYSGVTFPQWLVVGGSKAAPPLLSLLT